MTGRIVVPIRRASLVEQAIETMRGEIAAGAWPVGQRIPTEPELVATLGIGRNSLREATRALVHTGLLETRQGDGTYVRATSELAGAIQRRVNEAELIEVFEVRRALEAEAARLAALRRTDADVAELERLLAARSAAWNAGELARFVDVDLELHAAIAAAARNEMLRGLYGDFASAVHAAISDLVDDSYGEGEPFVHHALVAAIRARDPEAAQAATVGVLDARIAALRAES